MTAPELENFRTELIQAAAVAVAIVECIDYGVANASRSLEMMVRKSVDHTYQPTGEFESSQTNPVLQLVKDERYAQDKKWGPQSHDFAFWMSILGEEVGEAFKALNEDLLFPIAKEEERIGMGKPIRWGDPEGMPTTFIVGDTEVETDVDPADYGTPTTIHVNDPKARTMEQLFAEAREEADGD